MTHIGTQTIETQRLILRKFELSDAPCAYRYWAGVEEIQKNYAEPTYETLEKTEELLSQYIEKCESDDYYRWAVVLKETGECVGMVAFYLVNTDFEFGEIEYCIGKDFQNKGYITEATRALIDYGFEKIGFNRIQICCRDNNPKSRRVIEKCGFTFEGTLREYFKFEGEFCGRHYFSILSKEYENAKENIK